MSDEVNICPVCGAEFEDKSSNKTKIYCSKQCNRKACYERDKERRSAEPMVSKCLMCGRMFTYIQQTKEERHYCSKECKYKAISNKRRITAWDRPIRKTEPKRTYNKKKKKVPNKALIDTAVKAREMGMSYGQYVARYHV